MASAAPFARLKYKYGTLPDADTIRLMHLEPALDLDAPLRCSFTQKSVSDLVTEYEAVSYTWGEPILAYPLHVEDAYILVTKNLDQALRKLRLPTSPRALWSDAVCINQHDEEEKAQQIPLMATVFRDARRVLAWLDGGYDEERGLRFLDSLSRQMRSTSVETSDQLMSRWTPPSEQGVKLRLIQKFLGLAWFTRVWIIQEIVMNVDAVLICGAMEISWIRLVTVVEHLKSILDKSLDDTMQRKLDALQVIIALWKYHNLVNGHRDPTSASIIRSASIQDDGILGIVNMLSSYACTDDRDRIFALYSMAPDIQPRAQGDENLSGDVTVPTNPYDPWLRYAPTEGLSGIRKLNICLTVSYSLSMRQLYQDFATACIAKGRAISLLNSILARQYTPSSADWPSWVPDWRKPPSKAYIALNHSLLCRQVARNVVALLPRYSYGAFDHFMVVDSVIQAPETAGALVSFLRATREHWTPLNLMLMVEDLLYGEEQTQVIHFINYLLEDDNDQPDVSSLEGIQAMSRKLHAAMCNRCLFEVKISEGAVLTIGHGNAAILPGDKLFTLQQMDWDFRRSRDDPQALVVRLNDTVTTIGDKEVATHRLIGSAYFTGVLKQDPYEASWDPETWTKLYLT